MFDTKDLKTVMMTSVLLWPIRETWAGSDARYLIDLHCEASVSLTLFLCMFGSVSVFERKDICHIGS